MHVNWHLLPRWHGEFRVLVLEAVVKGPGLGLISGHLKLRTYTCIYIYIYITHRHIYIYNIYSYYIYLFIYSFIYVFIYLFVYLCIYRFIYLFTYYACTGISFICMYLYPWSFYDSCFLVLGMFWGATHFLKRSAIRASGWNAGTEATEFLSMPTNNKGDSGSYSDIY